jgi:GT2 family glycosyltransferase
LGGFDERFFMYYEDVDLSWRMRRNGLHIVFEPRSVVRHIHAGSSGEWSPSFRYHVTRNYRLNGFKNARVPQLLVLTIRLSLALGRALRVGGFGVWRKRSSINLQAMSAVEIEFKALAETFALIPRILFRRMVLFFGKR